MRSTPSFNSDFPFCSFSFSPFWRAVPSLADSPSMGFGILGILGILGIVLTPVFKLFSF
jgi:hypothetical protein